MHTSPPFWRRVPLPAALMVFLVAGSAVAQTPVTIVQIAASQHVLVLTAHGEVWGWGQNGSGQLGEAAGARLRSTTWVAHPIPIPLPGKIVGVCAAGETSYAVLEDGSVLAWGDGRKGQLGNGEAGLEARTKIGRPGSERPVRVTGLTGVVQLACGGATALALMKDGTVRAWGSRESGQVGDGHMPEQWGVRPPFASVPVVVPGLAGMTQVSVGADHAMALSAESRVFAWGSNQSGQLGQADRRERPFAAPAEVPGLTGVKAIAAGYGVSSVIREDGSVWVWGASLHGQLGDGSLGKSADRYNGSVFVPQPVKGVVGATAIASGHAGRHTMVLLKDGTLRAWGNSDWGQIGAGVSGTFQPRPQTPKIAGVKAYFLGGNHSFAIRNDGNLWIWGSEAQGEGLLAKNQTVPVQFPLDLLASAR